MLFSYVHSVYFIELCDKVVVFCIYDTCVDHGSLVVDTFPACLAILAAIVWPQKETSGHLGGQVSFLVLGQYHSDMGLHIMQLRHLTHDALYPLGELYKRFSSLVNGFSQFNRSLFRHGTVAATAIIHDKDTMERNNVAFGIRLKYPSMTVRASVKHRFNARNRANRQ